MRANSPAAAFLAQFVYPYWSPPATLGIQVVDFGEGGPSGDLHVKGTTMVPWAQVTGFCGAPVALSYPTLRPMPQGTPLTRPAKPQVAYGYASNFEPMTTIRGLMKSPANGGA